MKGLKKFTDIVSWIILIILSCLLIYSVYTVKTTPNNGEGAFIFGYRPILALSGSMEPYLMTNGIAITEKVDSLDEIEVGDVITYKMFNPDGSPVHITHRIISISDEGAIRTKGDNNNVDDNYDVFIEQVEAKVISVFNQSAWIIQTWHKGPMYQFFLIATPLSLVVLYYSLKYCIVSTFFKKKEDDEDIIDVVEEETTAIDGEQATSKTTHVPASDEA